YKASFKVTDEAGETQESFCKFFVGKIRGINFYGNSDIIIDKPFNLPISFTSSDENEKSALFTYSLVLENEPDKILKQGTLNSADTKVDFKDLKSGTYILKASLCEKDEDTEDENSDVTHTIVLYHEKDKDCPVQSALWISSCGQKVDENGVAHITIGTTYKSHIYYVANSRFGIAEEGWLHYEPGLHDFSIKIPEGENQYISVDFRCYYGSKLYEGNAYQNNPKNCPSVKLKINSFRDKIVPDSKETWTFSLSNQDNKPLSGRLALEVISEAVNQLSPNYYGISTLTASANGTVLSSVYHRENSIYASWRDKSYPATEYQLPELNMYERRFFWGNKRMLYDLHVYESSANVRSHAVYDAMDMDAVAEEGPALRKNAEVASFGGGAQNEDVLNNVSVRESETKVALWQPMISVGENGEAIVEFAVPSENTTWRLNALAFNKATLSDKITKSMVASRPIMVKPSLPRFVRDCDETVLMANVMNGTEEEVEAEIIIEIFDPRNGKVLCSEKQNCKIAANGM
ncbi:MAG: hypothetical protein HUJ97_10025, partial [Bacteroidales bacterium]|nr:hypothetical protein [Bacteroidales bacterium]